MPDDKNKTFNNFGNVLTLMINAHKEMLEKWKIQYNLSNKNLKRNEKLMKKFHIISLGCSKNLVDSEEVKGLLLSGGFQYVDVAEKSEVLIINTCGFILTCKGRGN